MLIKEEFHLLNRRYCICDSSQSDEKTVNLNLLNKDISRNMSSNKEEETQDRGTSQCRFTNKNIQQRLKKLFTTPAVSAPKAHLLPAKRSSYSCILHLCHNISQRSRTHFSFAKQGTPLSESKYHVHDIADRARILMLPQNAYCMERGTQWTRGRGKRAEPP